MPPDQPAAPEGTAEKRRSVKRTADTSPVFAAALERLNRRSVIALIEEVIEQLNEHCEKIGISIEQNVAINAAYSKLEMHLHDLRVANDNCMIEINSIRQEINSLHAHIPCISVIEKIEKLNIKIDAMSSANSSSEQDGQHPTQPKKNKESKLAWCSSCFCIAAFILAAAALAWFLHERHHAAYCAQSRTDAAIEHLLQSQEQAAAKTAVLDAEVKRLSGLLNDKACSNTPPDAAAVASIQEQTAAQLAAFESRLKVLEERHATQAAVFQQKIEVNAQAIAKLDQCRAAQAPAKAADNAQQNPAEEEPLPPSTVTLATLETNLNVLTVLFQQKIASYEQSIIKLEKCCAAPPQAPIAEPPKKDDEQKPAPVIVVPPAEQPKQPANLPIDTNKDIIVLSGVNFDTAKSDLTEEAKKILTDVAATLKRALPDQRFEVAGHTDNKGDAKKNQRLSQDRAEAVRKFLIEQGIRQELLTSRGYGLIKPIAENTTPEGRAKNRRVELDKQ